MVVYPTGLKDPVKIGDSRSNRFRDIRLPPFVTNDDDDACRRTLCIKTSLKFTVVVGMIPIK